MLVGNASKATDRLHEKQGAVKLEIEHDACAAAWFCKTLEPACNG